ncbi:MAG: hypothetical protein HY023_16685 [Chloroflexi bacterium]|nr:hypothetical protein [Chloroflexota bacterium]
MNTNEWDDEKQRRLDTLRAREDAGTLMPAEQAELEKLFAILDELEWQQLRPALERMEREHSAAAAAIARLERTRSDLSELAARQRQLIIRARSQLKELLAEHRALLADYRRLNIEVPVA